MENLSTFVRTLGNQFIRGRKIFTGIIGLEGTVLDGNTSAGTSGQVLSTTGSGVQWITVGSSNVGELDDLTDVQVGTPSNGQLLRYDSESGLWYNWTPNYLDTTDGLNDLNGVVITSAASNQFLKYNGTNWVNANVLLSDLGDTSISSPSADQILVYGQPLGGTPGVNVWYNKTHNFLTTATNIDDLNNVIISTQTAGDILRYNGTNWVNVPFSNLENDTLDSVTDRGNTTTNTINVGGVITDYVEFDTSVTLGGDESQGYMAWNNDVDTVSVYPYDSTWFNIGQDMHWHVKNGTAHTIERGQVVMATGAVGNSGKIEAGLMVADGTVSSKYILGIAIRDIASGEFGKVASQGIIRGIDTSTLTEGSVLWCDPDTDGGLTSTEPDAPNLRLPVAFVVSSGTNGAIAVRVTTGNVLHELHDVDAPSPATGDLLRYSALTGIWENWTPTYISSFTEADPIFVASPAHGIASTDITNWNTAYGWGNHATAGYLTSLPNHNHDDRYYTETEVNTLLAGKAAVSHTHEIEDITGLSDSLDLKLETESDTLNSVTGRGNTTSNTIFVGSARGSSGTYGTGIYGDNSGASVQFGTSAAVDSLGIIGAYSSQFNINSKNGPLSFQYYGTEYMNISAAGALKLNSYGAGLLKTDANGNVTVDTNVYITADDQELTWEQSTKELSISDGNTVTLSGLASIADVEGYGYITTEVDTLNTVTTRGATTTNDITVGSLYSGLIRGSSQIDANPSSGAFRFYDGSTFRGGLGTGAWASVGASSDIVQYLNSVNYYISNGTTALVKVQTNGNVGIGTTSPNTWKLSVDSSTIYAASFDTSNNVGVVINGNDTTASQIIGFSNSASTYNALHLRTNSTSTSGLYINTSGNVGIGTTSPSQKLEVVGDIRIGQNSAIRFNTSGSSNDPGLAMLSDASFVFYNTASSTTLKITNGGNVGIGTTSPDRQLQVHSSDSGTSTAKFTNSTTGEDGDTGFFVGINGSEEPILYGYNATDMRFGTNGSDRMRITSAGNVGIGTTSPSYKLHVYGGTDQLKLQSTGTDSRINIGHSANGGYIGYTNLGATSNVFYVTTGAGTIGSGIVMDNNGNVGIGTTSPGAKLEVSGTGVASAATLKINTSSSSTFVHSQENMAANLTSGQHNILVIGQRTNTKNSGYIGYYWAGDASNSNFVTIGHWGVDDIFRVYGNSTVTMSGSVGIGTTSPGAKLHINGGGAADTEKVIVSGNDAIIRLGGANTNGPHGLQFGYDSNVGSDGMSMYYRTGPEYIIFENSTGTSGTGVMVIQRAGNVGIGTTSPLNKLSVISRNNTGYYQTTTPIAVFHGAAPAILVANDANTSGAASELRLGNAHSTYYPYSAYIKGLQGAGIDRYRLEFGTSNGAAASTAMTISQEGNVGIGTTNPYSGTNVRSLDINATAYSVLALSVGGTNVASLVGYSNSVGLFAKSGNYITLNPNDTEAVRITSGGNVGIGTTSPSYKLDVNGSFNASNITATSYSVIAGKTTYTKSFGYIDTTGSAVAGLRGSSNGASAMFTFEMYGGSGQYQKVVYSCQNAGGNWYPYKVIDQGTNNLDVVASANGTTITFTFKAITSTQYYSPTVVIEHVGAAIEPSYL